MSNCIKGKLIGLLMSTGGQHKSNRLRLKEGRFYLNLRQRLLSIRMMNKENGVSNHQPGELGTFSSVVESITLRSTSWPHDERSQ